MMYEKQAWQELLKAHKKVVASALAQRPSLGEGGYIDRLQRVENVVADGVPDINGCIEGIEFWIELKCPKVPKRPNTPLFGSNHRIGPNQFAWFKAQYQAGGNVYLLISCYNELHQILLDATQLSSSIHLLSLKDILELPSVVYYSNSTLTDSWYNMRQAILSWSNFKG